MMNDDMAALVERLEASSLCIPGNLVDEAASTIRNYVVLHRTLVAENEQATVYLRAFLVSFVREHFPENTKWQPLPDLLGMLTQIDNASTIARDHRARAEAAEAKLRVSDALLREAVEVMRVARGNMEAWASYASDYFREKHDLAGDLAEIDAFLATLEKPNDP